MAVKVIVKHQGEKYEVEIEAYSTGEDFKLQLFSLTSVEPERQKIVIKGSQLKNDADMDKIGLKSGQVIMMLGTPSANAPNLVRPKDAAKFIEDITEEEKAQQVNAFPAGLVNLGNTCYLNSTLQTLRSIPELQTALLAYSSTRFDDFSHELLDLLKKMTQTQEAYSPIRFLTSFRQIFPQFAEKAQSNNGYAQQDAEEAWSQIINYLCQKLNAQISEDDANLSFIDRHMSGEFTSSTVCDEPDALEAGEKAVVSKDRFYKLNCHIDGSTNHLRDGILDALDEKLKKRSDTLGREAVYTKRSSISRAPQYLTVHFVRFFWKRATQMKAKIMRKVTFPQELDLVEFCSEDLKKALIPVRDKVHEIRKDEEDIERSRRRRKTQARDLANTAGGAELPSEKRDTKAEEPKPADGDTLMGESYKTDAEIDAEKDAALLAAKKELNAIIDPALRKDEGANQSGLYELRGVVTHQGASADSGHYTAFIKKTAPVDPTTGKKGEEDGKWWWFNDAKVSEVTVDKVEALAGGGESHSALILLYKAIPLPTAAGIMD